MLTRNDNVQKRHDFDSPMSIPIADNKLLKCKLLLSLLFRCEYLKIIPVGSFQHIQIYIKALDKYVHKETSPAKQTFLPFLQLTYILKNINSKLKNTHLLNKHNYMCFFCLDNKKRNTRSLKCFSSC